MWIAIAIVILIVEYVVFPLAAIYAVTWVVGKAIRAVLVS